MSQFPSENDGHGGAAGASAETNAGTSAETTDGRAAGGPAGQSGEDVQVSADDQMEEEPGELDYQAASELVEVYHTDDQMVALMVSDEILGPARIQALIHDRRSHAIPAPASMPGEIACERRSWS